MSVVAGCSLFDGVLLAADCRATIQRRDKSTIHSDSVLKVLALMKHTAIAFVGDIDVAAYLIKTLIINLKNRKHRDPISLSLWMPRFFRYKLNEFTAKNGDRKVVFMVASVLRNRRNLVERKAVVDLFKYITSDKSPIKRNWIPQLLIEAIKVPEHFRWIEIPNTFRNLLYTLESPNFDIQFYAPLQCTAIGSGESCLEHLELYHDAIFALDLGNSFVEGEQFRSIINNFIDEKGIASVGGLYPVIKISSKGLEHLGVNTTVPVGGTRIELFFQNGRWIQRNISEKKEIHIVPPWEFIKSKAFSERFDDLNYAMRRFRS